MLSRFYVLHSPIRCGMINATSTQFANISRRPFSLNLTKMARSTMRDKKSFRQNFQKQESIKVLNTKSEVLRSDSIPVRPASHLLKAFGFTLFVSICYIFLNF